MGYSPSGHKDSEMTEQLSLNFFFFFLRRKKLRFKETEACAPVKSCYLILALVDSTGMSLSFIYTALQKKRFQEGQDLFAQNSISKLVCV